MLASKQDSLACCLYQNSTAQLRNEEFDLHSEIIKVRVFLHF